MVSYIRHRIHRIHRICAFSVSNFSRGHPTQPSPVTNRVSAPSLFPKTRIPISLRCPHIHSTVCLLFRGVLGSLIACIFAAIARIISTKGRTNHPGAQCSEPVAESWGGGRRVASQSHPARRPKTTPRPSQATLGDPEGLPAADLKCLTAIPPPFPPAEAGPPSPPQIGGSETGACGWWVSVAPPSPESTHPHGRRRRPEPGDQARPRGGRPRRGPGHNP